MDNPDNRLSPDRSGIGDYLILINGYTIWNNRNFQSTAIVLIVNCYNF
jgi:hypothetical protein